MEDKQIVELYWQRSENAIHESEIKYGKYCRSIAMNILDSLEDALECVNDTWLDAWNSMPPHRPSVLSTYLGKITRRISIDKWRRNNASKRGSGEMTVILDELEYCLESENGVERHFEQKELSNALTVFISGLSEKEKRVFLCRYWYAESVADIARRFSFSEGKVKSLLFRTRKKLHDYLMEEGFI